MRRTDDELLLGKQRRDSRGWPQGYTSTLEFCSFISHPLAIFFSDFCPVFLDISKEISGAHLVILIYKVKYLEFKPNKILLVDWIEMK